MANPLCPKCGSKLTNKTDVNLEGVTGGISEHLKSFFIVYCEKCGFPIGVIPK